MSPMILTCITTRWLYKVYYLLHLHLRMLGLKLTHHSRKEFIRFCFSPCTYFDSLIIQQIYLFIHIFYFSLLFHAYGRLIENKYCFIFSVFCVCLQKLWCYCVWVCICVWGGFWWGGGGGGRGCFYFKGQCSPFNNLQTLHIPLQKHEQLHYCYSSSVLLRMAKLKLQKWGKFSTK